MIAEKMLETIEKEGVVLNNKDEVLCSLNQSINKGNCCFITVGGNDAGFFTFKNENGKVLVNNLLILKEYRGKFNLLRIRKFLRSKYGAIDIFYWKNRKSQKMIERKNLCLAS